MVDEIGEVGDLNPWDVTGMGLVPIPRAATAGPQFHVLPCPEAMDLHDSPRQMLNGWRFRMFGHGAISLRRMRGSRPSTRNGVAMKVLCSFVFGSLFGAAAVSVAIAVTQSEIDPVKISPQYYTVRIDNDRVRVLEYRLGA